MSKGKHRKRHLRRAVITTGIAALAVLGTGIGIARALSSPQEPVRISADPVIAPEAAPRAPAPRTGKVYYVVREGDSAWGIAASQCHSGNDWKALATANHLSYPYPVTPGQKIAIAC